MDLAGVAAIFVAVLLGGLFWRHIQIGHRACLLAKAHTQKQGVLLLDQTVVLVGVRFRLQSHTGFALERRYAFEFATRGDQRYSGTLTLLGRRLKQFELQPFKESIEAL